MGRIDDNVYCCLIKNKSFVTPDITEYRIVTFPLYFERNFYMKVYKMLYNGFINTKGRAIS